MDAEMKKVLQNVAVIKVNQDPLGIQGKYWHSNLTLSFTESYFDWNLGRRVLNETDAGILKDMSVWTRPLIDDEFAVAVVSYRTDGRPQPIHFTLKQVKSFELFD